MENTTNPIQLPNKPNTVGLYVIYDNLAEQAGPVFTAVNDAVAIRNVVNMLLDVDIISINDYSLHRVAIFDQITMELHNKIEEVDFLVTYFDRKSKKEKELANE